MFFFFGRAAHGRRAALRLFISSDYSDYLCRGGRLGKLIFKEVFGVLIGSIEPELLKGLRVTVGYKHIDVKIIIVFNGFGVDDLKPCKGVIRAADDLYVGVEFVYGMVKISVVDIDLLCYPHRLLFLDDRDRLHSCLRGVLESKGSLFGSELIQGQLYEKAVVVFLIVEFFVKFEIRVVSAVELSRVYTFEYYHFVIGRGFGIILPAVDKGNVITGDGIGKSYPRGVIVSRVPNVRAVIIIGKGPGR